MATDPALPGALRRAAEGVVDVHSSVAAAEAHAALRQMLLAFSWSGPAARRDALKTQRARADIREAGRLLDGLAAQLRRSANKADSQLLAEAAERARQEAAKAAADKAAAEQAAAERAAAARRSK